MTHPHSHDTDHSHIHDHDHQHQPASVGGGFTHRHAPDAPEHYHPDEPGKYEDRDPLNYRSLHNRAYTVGIGGPVGSGKTALMLSLCRRLRDKYSLVAVTNDIFTKEDGEFLTKHGALEPASRIRAIETGGCPHAAIREDCSANLHALEQLTTQFAPVDLCLVESGGDNLAANYSRELADYIIYVIDVAGGDKIPRKGGPGITQSDLLVVNKTDLAKAVGADLVLMEKQAKQMRSEGPVIFAQVKHMVGVDEIIANIVEAWNDHKHHLDHKHGHAHTHTHADGHSHAHSHAGKHDLEETKEASSEEVKKQKTEV